MQIRLITTALVAAILITGCTPVPWNQAMSGDIISEHQRPILLSVVSGECDTLPIFVSGVAPIYPRPLYHDRIYSGSATLTYTVTKDGRVKDPHVKEATHPQFAAGVAYVMPTWRFKPAVLHGQPVEVVVESTVQFTGSDF